MITTDGVLLVQFQGSGRLFSRVSSEPGPKITAAVVLLNVLGCRLTY